MGLPPGGTPEFAAWLHQEGKDLTPNPRCRAPIIRRASQRAFLGGKSSLIPQSSLMNFPCQCFGAWPQLAAAALEAGRVFKSQILPQNGFFKKESFQVIISPSKALPSTEAKRVILTQNNWDEAPEFLTQELPGASCRRDLSRFGALRGHWADFCQDH